MDISMKTNGFSEKLMLFTQLAFSRSTHWCFLLLSIFSFVTFSAATFANTEVTYQYDAIGNRIAQTNISADTDFDGILDSWEILNFGSLNHDMSQDTDRDGLIDEEEFYANTLPLNNDSDGDGVNDGYELQNGLNPLDSIDATIDTDNDGLPDAFESYHGLDLNDPLDASLDSDGDGYSILEEYYAHTSDSDSLSYPLTLIDFESGVLNGPLFWMSGGDQPWEVKENSFVPSDHAQTEPVLEGIYSMRSGDTHDTSEISTTFKTPSDSIISFIVKVDSYVDDKLVFYIDGIEQNSWSGSKNSYYVEHQLAPGKHTIKWSYIKDGNPLNDTIFDLAVIDDISILLETDSDNDSINDSWEYLYFDSLIAEPNLDFDNDGLTDIQEFQLGSNPTLIDSDSDGLNDFDEEQVNTNPNQSDTDDDGMPDGWEVNNNLNPLVDDSNLDPDNDGISNLSEYLAGSDPNLDDSSPPPVEFDLSISGYKVKGKQKADLSWNVTNSTNVDVYRDGTFINTTGNDGNYTDPINRKGGGSYVYIICESQTNICSSSVGVSF